MHSLDSSVPLPAQGDEGFLHLVESFRAGTYQAVPVHRTLDDEPGVFEDGDVALHRSERHRICGCEIADGQLAPHRPGDDVAPRWVCERSQASIDFS